jgi:hypothetical protein
MSMIYFIAVLPISSGTYEGMTMQDALMYGTASNVSEAALLMTGTPPPPPPPPKCKMSESNTRKCERILM